MKDERYILHNEKYHTEGFRGSTKKFNEIGKEVSSVLNKAIEEVFVARHGEETAQKRLEVIHFALQNELTSPVTTAALLRENKHGNIVGFTYAYPSLFSNGSPMYDQEFAIYNLSETEREEALRKTAEVGWTAILKEHRGQGGWTLMMNNLEVGLAAKKDYDYHARFVRKDNDYAEKIRQRYKENIVYESSFNEPSFLGEQAYFRIRLDK